MNIVDAKFLGGTRVGAAEALFTLQAPLAGAGEGEAVKLGIRPEHLAPGDRRESSLRAHVDFAEYLGSTRYLYCNLAGGESITVEQRDGGDFAAGDEVWLNCDASSVRLFSAAGERLRSASPSKVADA